MGIYLKFYRRVLIAVLGGIFFILVAPFLLHYWTQHSDHAPTTFCVFKNLTGHPCPGCGISRSSVQFWTGHFKLSLWYNPIGFFLNLTIPLVIGWVIRDFIRKDHSFYRFIHTSLPVWAYILLGLAVTANWIFNFYKGF